MQTMKLGHPSPRPSCAAGAFTIADVVVAVLVLGIITGAFYTALSSSFFVVQSTREDLRATQIMMQKIEAIRLCTWDELTNFSFQEIYDPLSTNTQSAGSVYFGTVTIGAATNVSSTASYYPSMDLVTVNLLWTNSYGGTLVPHSRQMQTHVARYGLQNYIWGATR